MIRLQLADFMPPAFYHTLLLMLYRDMLFAAMLLMLRAADATFYLLRCYLTNGMLTLPRRCYFHYAASATPRCRLRLMLRAIDAFIGYALLC